MTRLGKTTGKPTQRKKFGLNFAAQSCRLLGMCAVFLSISACGSDPPEVLDNEQPANLNLREMPAVPTFDYRIGPRDVLRVNVFGHPELSSATFQGSTPGTPVSSSGMISLPLIGNLDCNGKTVFEIQEDIVLALRRYIKQPHVDIAVLEFRAHRVFVLGEVETPGMYTLDRPLNLLQALALGGGFTSDANREQVALVRGPISEENVRLFNAQELDPLGSAPVRAGDILFVGRRSWADLAQAARDLVPLLQVVALPVSTVRDVVIIENIRSGN